MTHTIKTLSFSAIAALVFLAGFALFYTAKANPSFFIRTSTNTGFASTTVVYQSAGLATTTLIMDTGVGGAQGADSAVLLQQFIGSTTAATQKTTIEYAQGGAGINCATSPTQCDWYLGLATSTTATGIQSGGIGGLSSTTLTSITVPTPTRYVRAVFSIPAGGVSGAIYAELAAKRQGN